MTLSMYDASVPVFVRQLNAMSAFLTLGESSAKSRAIDPEVLINARLAPDMHPLSRQIQIASDSAKGGAARLAGLEAPSMPDVERTFEELQERIAKTVDFLQSVPREAVDGSEARVITLKIGGQEMQFSGQAFLLQFVTPNFYFHAAAAYAILRHNGVPVGKRDFLAG
jgi:hypothetical protein